MLYYWTIKSENSQSTFCFSFDLLSELLLLSVEVWEVTSEHVAAFYLLIFESFIERFRPRCDWAYCYVAFEHCWRRWSKRGDLLILLWIDDSNYLKESNGTGPHIPQEQNKEASNATRGDKHTKVQLLFKNHH